MLQKNQEKCKEFFLYYNQKIFFEIFNDFFYEWFPSTKLYSMLKKIGINIDVVLYQYTFKFKVLISNRIIIKYLKEKIIMNIFKILKIYFNIQFFSRIEHKTVFQFFLNSLKDYFKMKKLIFNLKKSSFFFLNDINRKCHEYPFYSNKNEICFELLINNSPVYFLKTQIYEEQNHIIDGYYINLQDFQLFKRNSTFFAYQYPEYPFKKIALLKHLKNTKMFFKIGTLIYIYNLECTFISNKISFIKYIQNHKEVLMYLPLKRIQISFCKKIPLERIYYTRRNPITLLE